MVKDVTHNTDANDFYVVGVGASAGGLEALEKFFVNADAKTEVAFVVVQHLSPDYKSLMVELLSKHTIMPVKRAEDGMKVQKNNVYLIPPKKNMTIFHGKLFLTDQKPHSGLNLPIDIFFRSLADDFAEKAVGVVLSGTGSDGTLGIRAIKGANGMVMAQDEDTAKFDGMPRSAIATGMVDFILPPEKMGEQILKYTNHPLFLKNKPNVNAILSREDHYSKVLSLIRASTGADFTFYKPNTIVRRIERRMSIHQLENIEDYVNILTNSDNEVKILYKELLIGVTKFFRDVDAFSIIQNKVIPKLLTGVKQNNPLRFWVTGCSTGEEAYSIAILIKEYLEEKDVNADIKVFATDIDKDAIEYASAGVYPESIVADVSMERLNKYFVNSGNTYKINENIRQMVIFATHNITKDPPFSKIDFISCRNLLIYFDHIMQKKVLSAFSFSLKKDGFLFLGSSESLGDLADSFSTFDIKWKIYNNLQTEKRSLLESFHLAPSPKSISKPRNTENNNEKIVDTYDMVADTLFYDYVPPAVLIDEKYNIIHAYNDVNKLLKIPLGKVSLNLMNMIPQDLSIPVITSVHKAFKENKEINYSDLAFKIDDEFHYINLKAKPIRNEKYSTKYLLIVFETIIKNVASEYTRYEIDKNKSARVNDLEQQLLYTKENLQATIEEMETSNEELQATNEELIASNEELQSTNEELQSVNEELYTVNSEYQLKIDELTELNNDINNWFKTSDISTIFLDLKLRVRKFTPEISRYVNLIHNDLGRPFKHISYNFDCDNFFEKVEKVLNTLQNINEEVKIRNGKWVMIKILPYRTIDNAVKGIVITFIDITERIFREQEIARERDLLFRILDNSPIAKVLVDSDGRISYSNKKAEELFHFSKNEMSKLNFNSKEWKVTDKDGNDILDEERPFSIIMNSGKSINNHIEYFANDKGKLTKLSISGSPVFDSEGIVSGVVFALEILD